MTDTNEAARGGRRAGQDATVGELARQLPEQISRLVREELRLAQLEMTQKGKRAGIGAGLLGGGGVVALYGVAALLAAVIVAMIAFPLAFLFALSLVVRSTTNLIGGSSPISTSSILLGPSKQLARGLTD